MTYIYSESTAVVGPLASFPEPHAYDLCEAHAVGFTVPRGWQVMRHEGEFPAPIPHADDLEALADAVRDAARGKADHGDGSPQVGPGRRSHLRVVKPHQRAATAGTAQQPRPALGP